jgi:hypothetical protein
MTSMDKADCPPALITVKICLSLTPSENDDKKNIEFKRNPDADRIHRCCVCR